jgi:hypothetical protein
MAQLQVRASPKAFPATRDEERILRRKCACPSGGAYDGVCESCRSKASSYPSTPPVGALAPPIVHDVLCSPGQPLSTAARSLMEPRFGHDFGRVRIHTDAWAADSAAAVGALAYTVGPDIVFGAGQFAPESAEGRALLAHELAHVVQQRPTASSLPERMEIGPVDDPFERSAETQAGEIVAGRTLGNSGAPSGPARLQRANRTPATGGDAGAPAPTPGPAPDAGVAAPVPAAPGTPAAVCGPDVTKQVGDVVADMNSAWGGWNATQREEACWSLQNAKCGPDAWDIVQLHNNAWIYEDYRPACASAGAKPPCGSTVQVGNDCHFAGSVNYAIFGRQCKLCDIWPTTMHSMIWVHKVHWSGLDPDYAPAKAWADAGYAGWPGAATPGGDRNTCAPSCPTPYTPTANNGAAKFDFHWVPTHKSETISGDCNQAIDLHRDLRDNPPDFSGGVPTM